MIYLPTNLHQTSTINVGKYTSPMDPMSILYVALKHQKHTHKGLSAFNL